MRPKGGAAWPRVAFYWLIKTVAWPVTHTYLRLGVRGGRRVPRSGACLIVANHSSYLDAMVLGSACPRRLTFLITKPIYSMWRLRWFYYMMGSIPVSADAPDPGALKRALRTLQKGGVVGIFPEGQRMPDGNLGEGKAGAALIAARSGVPVIPAAIIGAHLAMPVGAMLPRPLKVQVVFGAALRFPGDGRRPSRQQLEAFAERLMQAIAELKDGGEERDGRSGDGVRVGST